LIDNASDAETKKVLSDFKVSKDNIRVIENIDNLGWVRAVNQALRLSEAPYVVMMNNDTIVRTDGWLSGLIGIAESSGKIGLVNPYFKAKRLATAGAEEPFIETDFCRGYCVLIKRAVIDKIGLLDESYGLGYYDDDDYSVRAIRAGFRCVRANNVFVEHLGDATFTAVMRDEKRWSLHERNKRLFYSKWGRRLRVVFIVTRDIPARSVSDLLFTAARKQHIVYLWSINGPFRLKHTSIMERTFPKPFQNLVFLAMLFLNRFKKKAKRYDIVFTDDKLLSAILPMTACKTYCIDMRHAAARAIDMLDAAAKV
jgi:GT2 family glycosyltransferase